MTTFKASAILTVNSFVGLAAEAKFTLYYTRTIRGNWQWISLKAQKPHPNSKMSCTPLKKGKEKSVMIGKHTFFTPTPNPEIKHRSRKCICQTPNPTQTGVPSPWTSGGRTRATLPVFAHPGFPFPLSACFNPRVTDAGHPRPNSRTDATSPYENTARRGTTKTQMKSYWHVQAPF